MSCRKSLLIISLLLGFVSFNVAADTGEVATGTGMWLRFHHGPSTFALKPGASLDLSFEPLPDFRIGGKLVSGAFFGYSTGAEVSATYSPEIGPWVPEVGAAAQAVVGSTIFYYHGGTDYVEVLSPEWSAGIVLRPLRFSFGEFGISTLDLVIGTDLSRFGKVLLVDVDLFRVVLYLGGE